MPRPTRRNLLAFGILGVWAVVVGMHIRREYFKPEAVRLEVGARALAPGALFYSVRMDGRAIGMATARLDTVPAGFLFEDFLALDVPAMDTTHRAVARTRVELTEALALRAFRFALDSEVGRFEVTGQADGDSLLTLEVGAGGDAQRSEIRLDRGAVLAAALPLRLAASGRLEVGERYTVPIFDPSSLSTRDVTLAVTGFDTLIVADTAGWDAARETWVGLKYDTLPVWRVEESMGGVSVSSWIDDDGRLVRAESPLGFTLERTAFELARQAWLEGADAQMASGYGAVIESTAIASDVPLDRAGSADRLAVRLLGVELAGFDLAGGRQTLSGDTLRIEREDPASLAPGYRLPYAGGGEPAEALAATPLIQSADPRILEAARAIAGDETDPIEVARRLNAWVYDALEKDITLSVPSAVQVLEAGQGDCNEHTVLYVALARALGLPARTAVGVVHIDGRFYYHAWPEVWLGEWVAVDPTLGQFPADAAHLRFLNGGLARQVELIRLIGRLRLEVA